MIKIPTQSLVKNKETFLKDVYPRFFDFLNSKKTSGDKEYALLISYLSDSSGNLSKEKIESIICGDLSTLKRISNDLESLYFNNGKSAKDSLDGMNDLYTRFSTRKLSYIWPDTIGVNVCPYCNRNYIYSIPKKKVKPEYDHYLPKSIFPYLCVSMYNLVPSCGICNRFKSNDNPLISKIIYPYSQEFGDDVYFTACNRDGSPTNMLNFNKKLSIKIECEDETKLPYSLDYSKNRFKLSFLYDKHSSLAEDIRKLCLIYKSDYINSLVDNYYWIKDSSEAIDLLFLNRLNKKEWHKRSLSKFISDIVKQFMS